MPVKAAKIINSLVVILMLLEIFGASMIACPSTSDARVSIHAAGHSASVVAAFLFEKAEEETEKSEEENNAADRVLLIDFAWVTSSLSLIHTPGTGTSPIASLFDVKPPSYTLNCVLLI